MSKLFERKALGELCSFTQGIQIPDKETKKEPSSGYIRYIYIRDLFTDKHPVFVQDIYPNKVLDNDDIVMVNTGNTAGTVYRGKRGVLCNNAFKISIKEDSTETLALEFLWFYLNSDARERMLTRFSNSAGQPHVGHKNVAKLSILLPSLPEQKKIAQILSTWDKAITTTEQLLANSQQQKKALMQQLLTGKKRLLDENGVRFNGEWIESKLEDFAKVYQPKTISQSDLIDEGFPVYGANGLIGFYSDFNHASEQIAVTCRGSTCGLVNWTKEKCWITGNAMVINVDDSSTVIKKFIYYSLKASNLTYLITGSGQPQITGELKRHKVKLPPLDEQLSIATALWSTDKELKLLETKISALKAEKKALMQQLLTGKRRVKVDEEAA